MMHFKKKNSTSQPEANILLLECAQARDCVDVDLVYPSQAFMDHLRDEGSINYLIYKFCNIHPPTNKLLAKSTDTFCFSPKNTKNETIHTLYPFNATKCLALNILR